MRLSNRINNAYTVFKYNVKVFFLKYQWKLMGFISKLAFKVIKKTAVWNPDFYDQNIIHLYQSVRKKQAFTFKEKIVGMKKGEQHIKLLLIETPDRNIEIKLSKLDHPELYNLKNKN